VVTISSVEAFFLGTIFSQQKHTLLVEITAIRQTPTLPLPIADFFGVTLFFLPLTHSSLFPILVYSTVVQL